MSYFLLGLFIASSILAHVQSFHINSNIFSKSVTRVRSSERFEVVVADGPKSRLDSFLSDQFPNMSRSFFGELCAQKHIFVDSIPREKSFKVSKGNVVHFEILEKQDFSVTPENIPLDILFEDSDLIVINKPNGMVVHPAAGTPNGTFVNALLYHLGDGAKKLLEPLQCSENSSMGPMARGGEEQEEDDFAVEYFDQQSYGEALATDLPETPEAAKASPMRLRPGVVHRLDKGTSGVLVAGKHTEAVAKMSALFARREVSKIYLAVCVGHPGDTTIVEPIGRGVKNRQLMAVYDGPPGKLAITHVRTIAFDGKISACLVRIETGRTHQIRVHLQHRRTPILGDSAYGNKEWNQRLLRSDAVERPLLHAYETAFTHPFTGERVVLRAPVPADMARLLQRLGHTGDRLVDPATGYLVGSTEVQEQRIVEQRRGFVPMDRIRTEEQHYTSFDLPENMPGWE